MTDKKITEWQEISLKKTGKITNDKKHKKMLARYLGKKEDGLPTWRCPICKAYFQFGDRKQKAWCDGKEQFLKQCKKSLHTGSFSLRKKRLHEKKPRCNHLYKIDLIRRGGKWSGYYIYRCSECKRIFTEKQAIKLLCREKSYGGKL